MKSFQSLQYKRNSWFRSIVRLSGTVIPAVLPRSLACGIFGIGVSIVHQAGLPVSQPILGSIIPSIVLGLLLVFRTNTAYDRFWEGRKWWGLLITNSRNLAWQIWVAIEEKDSRDHARKIAAERLIIAFAISKKLYLRGENTLGELAHVVSPKQYQMLQQSSHMPLQISLWLGAYLQHEYKNNRLSVNQLMMMQKSVQALMESLGNCERILKTPIPVAYSVHLNQLILLYCFLLPFQFVEQLVWLTGPFVALISFTLFGIEEIGVEIEQPFGYDANDLPLDEFCDAIENNIENLMKDNSLDSLAENLY
jgi:putative membrane protein